MSAEKLNPIPTDRDRVLQDLLTKREIFGEITRFEASGISKEGSLYFTGDSERLGSFFVKSVVLNQANPAELERNGQLGEYLSSKTIKGEGIFTKQYAYIKGSAFTSFVYEYLEIDLSRLIMRLKHSPDDEYPDAFEMRRIVEYTAEAVNFIHTVDDGNIVHRDLSASNILFPSDTKFFPRIHDFGISNFVTGNDAPVNMGTLEYMAPEAIMGKENSQFSDQYALVIDHYLLLSHGMYPLRAENEAAFYIYDNSPSNNLTIIDREVADEEKRNEAMRQEMRAHLARESYVPLTPEVAPREYIRVLDELNEVFKKALQRKPSNRFASVKEYKDALLDAMKKALLASLQNGEQESPPSSPKEGKDNPLNKLRGLFGGKKE